MLNYYTDYTNWMDLACYYYCLLADERESAPEKSNIDEKSPLAYCIWYVFWALFTKPFIILGVSWMPLLVSWMPLDSYLAHLSPVGCWLLCKIYCRGNVLFQLCCYRKLSVKANALAAEQLSQQSSPFQVKTCSLILKLKSRRSCWVCTVTCEVLCVMHMWNTLISGEATHRYFLM
jgi:hypothetical protein